MTMIGPEFCWLCECEPCKCSLSTKETEKQLFNEANNLCQKEFGFSFEKLIKLKNIEIFNPRLELLHYIFMDLYN